MSKHTPAPWTIDPENTGVEVFGFDGQFVMSMNRQPDELLANARLIASAPELLEALKRFVDVCDNGNPIDIFNALGSCVEPARQAIAKAEGTL